MSDRRTWRALHPSTRGVPAPAQDLGQSRSRIVIEPASVPEAAAKPALRHAGLYGARLVAWIPFLRHTRHGLVRSSGQDCFPPFGWRRQDQKDKAPRCRSKDGGGHEILLVGSIEANRRTCASLMTEARAFARL